MEQKIEYKVKKLNLEQNTKCEILVDNEVKNVEFAYKQGENYFFTGLADVGLIGAKLIDGQFVYTKGLKII